MSLSFGTLKSEEEKTVTLACHGKIVAGSEGAALREKVQQLMKDSPDVVLDLRNVDYIDSSGLGVLVSLYSTARAAGGTIKFENLATPVTYTKPTSLAS
jgi:anti-sigma B factor antagonist